MDTLEISWRTVLWPQFGAAIDMLENALVACPAPLWNQRLWSDHSDPSLSPEEARYAEFWRITYHTLVWLDLYLSASREEEFAPPAPFTWAELPEQPYTKEELHAYLASLRQQCHTTLVALTDEQARQPYTFPWEEGQTVSYLELQLYTMRHVQEHAAQLSLFLGQHGIPDEALDWVPRAQGNPGSR